MQRVGEPEVQTDEAPAFGTAMIDEALIVRAGQPLRADGLDFVSTLPEESGAEIAEILVQLELHAPRASGMST